VAIVDLRSDTVTRPTAGMRAAIARAEVGDDALGDDPTVQLLEQRVAQILGKEAALFFPSGIMANETALAIICQPGTEVICEATCHFVDWELGAPSTIAGVQLRGVRTDDGVLTAAHVAAAIRPRSSRYQLQTSAIALENTHNAAGGKVMPLATMQAIRTFAVEQGLPVHLDGARLWNACAVSGASEADYAACADTVMVTLSKALGCPVGSMLAGSAERMERARIMRRRLGGTMRQAGILAAAGIYALDHHRERMHEDHARAQKLAKLAADIPGLHVIEPETNIVMMEITRPGMTSVSVVAALRERNVLMVEFTHTRFRAVTHLDIDDRGVDQAAAALRSVFG
jgi:threonine aldolase